MQSAPNQADATLPKLFKGYELYAWEDSNGMRFMLITGTNRAKTLEELTAENGAIEQGDWIAISGRGLDALRRVLARLPEGTELALHGFAQLPPLDAATRAQVEALVARPR